jgi:hypothetical protein
MQQKQLRENLLVRATTLFINLFHAKRHLDLDGCLTRYLQDDPKDIQNSTSALCMLMMDVG